MADEQQPTSDQEAQGQPAPSSEQQAPRPRPSLPPIDPKDLEGLSPAERAALYKARARAAGVTPPQAGQPVAKAPTEQPAPAQPAAPATPAAPAEGAPAAAAQPAVSAPAGQAEPAQSTPAAAAPRPAAGPARPAGAAAGAKPAPPKPAEPEPDTEDVLRLREIAPDLTWERVHKYAEVTLPADKLLTAARLAREALGYDYLSAVTAVDYPDHFAMIYHLYSFDYRAHPGCLVLQVKLPKDAYPSIDSLTALWPGADFQERELWDLMGIKFLGHPDLRRILLADDFPGHPLRKDFVFDYEYVLVRHLRNGVEGQLVQGYVPPHERVAGPAGGAQ